MASYVEVISDDIWSSGGNGEVSYMITRLVHVSAHVFLGGAEVVHCAGVDQVKCALYLLIAALMVREMWHDVRGNLRGDVIVLRKDNEIERGNSEEDNL